MNKITTFNDAHQAQMFAIYLYKDVIWVTGIGITNDSTGYLLKINTAIEGVQIPPTILGVRVITEVVSQTMAC